MGGRNNRSELSNDGIRPLVPHASSPITTHGRATSQGYRGHSSNNSRSLVRERSGGEPNNGRSSASAAQGSTRKDLRLPSSLGNVERTKTQVNAVSLRETFRAQDYFRDSQRSPEEPVLCRSDCGKPIAPSMFYFHSSNSCYSRIETPPTSPGSSQPQLPTTGSQLALPSPPHHYPQQQQQFRQHQQAGPSKIAVKYNSPHSAPNGPQDKSRPSASSVFPMARTNRQAVVEDQLRRIGRPVLIPQHRYSYLQGTSHQ